jgi:GNAT superfamily N-acetyltransferase
MIEEGYSFERINENNLKHLITLYKNAFNIDVSINFLEKKYNTKCFGADYIGFLAITKNDIPAAYYGVFPLVSEIGGSKVVCAQSGDTMTHHDHRGKGLFVDLAKRTYELAKNNGIKFIFGFPNQNSYPGFVKKLNWVHNDDLNLYSIKVLTLPLVKIVKKLPFLNSVYSLIFNLITLFYKKNLHGFNNSLSVFGYDSLLHDENFFNYKSYFKSFFFKIKNKNVWLKIDGRLWIGDIEFSSQEEFNAVIKSLKRLAFFIGATEIHFHTHPNTSYDNYMSKLGSVKSKNPIGYLDLDSGLNISEVKFQSGDFDTF